MDKFDEFIAAVLDGSKDLARATLGGSDADARVDATAFLDKAQSDLRRWTRLLAIQEITERDFADLVQAKRALCEIHGLSRAGIGLAKLERFRSGLMDLVVDSAFKVFV